MSLYCLLLSLPLCLIRVMPSLTLIIMSRSLFVSIFTSFYPHRYESSCSCPYISSSSEPVTCYPYYAFSYSHQYELFSSPYPCIPPLVHVLLLVFFIYVSSLVNFLLLRCFLTSFFLLTAFFAVSLVVLFLSCVFVQGLVEDSRRT